MTYKHVFSALLAVIVIFSLCSCNDRSLSEKAQENETDLFAMDTYMSLKAYGDNGETALQKAADKIRELEALLSTTSEKSEIFMLNSAGGSQAVVSSDTSFLIERSLELNIETNGAFDITLYPITKEWGFTTGNYKVPSQDRIDELFANVGCSNIVLDKSSNSVSLKIGANIDLGGIAKGYAGSCAADIIRAEGVASAILNMGGNVQTIGSKPDGSSWKVGIQDPEDSTKLVGTVEVSDKAVITSGGYERYFQDANGNIYHHILDPKTGYPAAADVISVTVIGSDGTTCDALSTSLFVMGTERSAEFLKANRNYDAVIVSNDNKLYITKGMIDKFKASDKFSEYTIITI